MRRLAILLAAFVAIVAPLAASAPAGASASMSAAVNEEKRTPPAVRDQRTPRNAVFLFLSLAREARWAEAARCIEEPAAGWTALGGEERAARALKLVLDERLWIDLGSVTDDAEAPVPVRLGAVVAGDAELAVELAPEAGDWRFTRATIEGTPAMARRLGVWWVAGLPGFLTDIQFADIQLWQWIALAAIAVVGVVLGVFVSRLVRRGAELGSASGLGPAAGSVAAFAAPAGFLLSLLAMRAAEPALALSVPARASVGLGTRAATVFVLAWAVARWLRAMSVVLEARLEARGIGDATSIVRIGRVVAVGLVYLLGVSAALQVFGLDLSAVVAGLGIGTAAIALASQQTLGNLFGGASVLADRVLVPGDTCQIGGVVATVEKIGIRSTQLRTADRTLLVVANGDLAQSRVEKLSARDAFRLSAVLGLRYETPAATMEAVVADLRARLAADPLVDPDSIRVHFLAFNSSSLDIDLKATFRTTDALEYRNAVERLNLDILGVVERRGTGFAFPSQTVYLAKDAAPRAS
jgi:MscS family membrane protein